MSKLRVLDFKYNLSKRLPSKPAKWLSAKDRQISDLMPAFEPNEHEMSRVFKKIANMKEKIGLSDLKVLLERAGQADPACEAKRMMDAADIDGDEVIDFNEFMAVHKKGVKASDIRRAFRMFDRDGNGKINAEEIREMMGKLGEDCSLEECRRMVKHVAKDADGVDMGDFMAMMTSNLKPVR